jgi:hypothetical protein
MKDGQSKKETTAGPLRCDDTIACDECGRFGAYNFAGRHLCAECYQAGCSCCPEFGKDDLWEFPKDE